MPTRPSTRPPLRLRRVRPSRRSPAQYSTDASKDKGGSYGTVSRASTLDPTFLEALFALPEGGTTGIITGADGTYRIGKVATITPGTLDTSFQSEVQQRLSWDTYRSNVRMEAFAQKLKDSIVATASGPTTRSHAAEIFLSGDPTATGTADSGQVKASHILYSPNNDPQGAKTLAADDPPGRPRRRRPTWPPTQLRAVSDTDSRITDFAVRAKLQSDDTGSGANGGELGYFAADQMVTGVRRRRVRRPEPQAGRHRGSGQERLRLARDPVRGPHAAAPAIASTASRRSSPSRVPTSVPSPRPAPTAPRRRPGRPGLADPATSSTAPPATRSWRSPSAR